MKNITYQKVSDINCTYPYLDFFQEGELSTFLEVSVTDSKDLIFTFYPIVKEVQLSLFDWESILSTAKVFKNEVIKNEEDFQKCHPE